MDDRIAVIRLFPGIRGSWVRHALGMPDLRAAVITTFGSGNGPTDPEFTAALQQARERGMELLNVTQCVGGRVEQGRYVTSQAFELMGVVPCADMTVEAAVTKAMFLLANERATEPFAQRMAIQLCGESTLV